jgi:hypothetical protein
MDPADLLPRYRGGAAALAAAVAGATDDELDRRPAPDAWTAREVVHHVADSETMSAIRLRLLLAADAPVIAAYDEKRWAIELGYAGRGIDASLALVHAVRAASAELLATLRPEQWERVGTHSESGPYSVSDWMRIYAEHPYEHAEQARRARRGEA